jgi:hypothetical protein
MWSWILAVVGSFGVFTIGSKNIYGWVVLFLNECLWVAYALHTHQYGFIFASALYMGAYIRNYLNWRKDDKE